MAGATAISIEPSAAKIPKPQSAAVSQPNVHRHKTTASSHSEHTLCEESMLGTDTSKKHSPSSTSSSNINSANGANGANGAAAVTGGMAAMKLSNAPSSSTKTTPAGSRRNSGETTAAASSAAQQQHHQQPAAAISQAIASAAVTAPRIEKRPSLMQRFLGTGKSNAGAAAPAPKRASPPPSVRSAGHKRGGSEVSTVFEQKYGTCSRECIGRGATAVVRVAYKQHRDGPQVYAIKRFRKQRANESERDYIKKLTSEYCISSSIHHKNVVSTLDLIQDPSKNWCQVMEFCPGGDLYTVIRDGSMTLAENECCFKQMCEGIAHLHSMGVCHRDIKAENLLLDACCTVKITDFGVADVFRVAWEEKVHKSRGLCGSEPYIAPEMFSGKSYDGRKADVWSAAIVYYTMVYNGIPWRAAKEEDANYRRFLDAVRAGREYEGLRRIEPQTRRLLHRMLNPDPQLRPTMDEVMQSDVMKRIVVCDNEGLVPGGTRHCHYTEEYEERRHSRSMRAQAAAAAAGAATCRNNNGHQ
ncbi:hypothetical protein GGI07_000506 [Coemansia sp. Benny D115]|nr:hypothetical protein GGI07_000506 [Coemansia sp. Benny D115]